VKFNTAACLRSRDAHSNDYISFPFRPAGGSHVRRNRPARFSEARSSCLEISLAFRQRTGKSPAGILVGLRDIFQYLPTASVPGLALRALILHYINKGLKNQGCRGKRIGVVEASRYSANTRLPSLSIFLLRYVFHLRAKGYYTSGGGGGGGVESAIAMRARAWLGRKRS